MIIGIVEIKKVEVFIGQMVKAFSFEDNKWIDVNVIDINSEKWEIVFADADNKNNCWADTLPNVSDTSQYKDWEILS